MGAIGYGAIILHCYFKLSLLKLNIVLKCALTEITSLGNMDSDFNDVNSTFIYLVEGHCDLSKP